MSNLVIRTGVRLGILKPKLDGRLQADIELYSLDDLREIYQKGTSDFHRLREGIITTDELRNVILYRASLERFRFHLTFWVALVAMVAAIIAAVEGWKPPS